jgi:hypothetical protein
MTDTMITVIPSGRTINAANCTDGYFVECIGTADTPYKHNTGIVAFIKGDTPTEPEFGIRNGRTRAHLGLYRVIEQPAGAKFRSWVQVPNSTGNPQRMAQSHTAALLPSHRLLVGTTASLSSQI